MNVLIIPEDFRKDQYVLKPVIEAMLTAVGKPRANVKVCTDPLLAGVDQALSWFRIEEILDMYPMVQLFLLIVDRDGNTSRRSAMDAIEAKAERLLGKRAKFFAEHAWQEVEVWALAGQELPTPWKWTDIRDERDPKEKYFVPLAKSRGLLDEPGQGMRTLGKEAGSRYRRVRSRCVEDIQALERRL